LAFRSAVVPVTAISDPKATIARSLILARVLDMHLHIVFVRPDPAQTFAYGGLQPTAFDVATKRWATPSTTTVERPPNGPGDGFMQHVKASAFGMTGKSPQTQDQVRLGTSSKASPSR